jgi:DNA (cytosine-5)-methyltransferase 1
VPDFYEFFAGGGMARAGLGAGWSCLFANDFDSMKASTYTQNWGNGEMLVEDIGKLKGADLPGVPSLVWASFPCQDLSLAGLYKGLGNESDLIHTRSGTFWAFVKIVRDLHKDGRGPKMIALENVVGTLSSNKGRDFQAICDALSALGYRFGAMVVDAVRFLPQSRPRVFFVAVHKTVTVPKFLSSPTPDGPWFTTALMRAHASLKPAVAKKWIWWCLPVPASREVGFLDIIEESPASVRWHSKAETNKILGMMSPTNLAKVKEAKASKKMVVGGVYFRTRVEDGVKVQRAEVRFDYAGCLRTPSGGASRQRILLIEGSTVRSRLLSSREAARLMGLPDSYELPKRYTDGYHIAGDGVAVPVVDHIARSLIDPILTPYSRAMAAE